MHFPRRLSLSISTLSLRGRRSRRSNSTSSSTSTTEITATAPAASFAPFDFISKKRDSLYSIFPPPLVADYNYSPGIRLVDDDDDEEEVHLLDEEALGWTVLEPRPRSPGGVERGLFEVLDGEF
jgi:hypothetical protein